MAPNTAIPSSRLLATWSVNQEPAMTVQTPRSCCRFRPSLYLSAICAGCYMGRHDHPDPAEVRAVLEEMAALMGEEI